MPPIDLVRVSDITFQYNLQEGKIYFKAVTVIEHFVEARQHGEMQFGADGQSRSETMTHARLAVWKRRAQHMTKQ